jgi:hypothetical protein
MTSSSGPRPLLQGLHKHDYNIVTLEDEMRVDQLCVDLLRRFGRHLTQQAGLSSEEAGEICHGADYFLREFIIADRRQNLFEISENRVRQFAGHWYITRTPEPNLTELRGVLKGTAAFYEFLSTQGLVDAAMAGEIAERCSEFEYYQKRIDDFWAIEGEGFETWRQACPLEPVPDIS